MIEPIPPYTRSNTRITHLDATEGGPLERIAEMAQKTYIPLDGGVCCAATTGSPYHHGCTRGSSVNNATRNTFELEGMG